MIIEALSGRAPNWKQPKFLPVSGLINKLWYDPYNGILHSNKKGWTIDTCKNMTDSQNKHAE